MHTLHIWWIHLFSFINWIFDDRIFHDRMNREFNTQPFIVDDTLHGWWQVNLLEEAHDILLFTIIYYRNLNLLCLQKHCSTTIRVKNCKNWAVPSYLMKGGYHLFIVHDKRVPTCHQIWREVSSFHERWRVVTTFHISFLLHGITG